LGGGLETAGRIAPPRGATLVLLLGAAFDYVGCPGSRSGAERHLRNMEWQGFVARALAEGGEVIEVERCKSLGDALIALERALPEADG
jgi:hypothetical protein